MDEYKHYVRPDENGIIILGFTSAFPEIAIPQSGDLLLSGQEGRHFNFPLTNDRGQFVYKVVNGAIALRNATELNAEWDSRPAPPPTLQEQVDEMKITLGDFILFGGA